MDVNNLYSFDKIFGKRLNNGMDEFAVKWSGYDWSDSTWEPVANFTADAIQVFEGKLQQHGVQYGLILNAADVEEILEEAFGPLDEAPEAPEEDDLPMDIDIEEVANENYEWDADHESDSDYEPELEDLSDSD